MASGLEFAEVIFGGGQTGNLRFVPLMVAIVEPPPSPAGDSAPPPAHHFMLINPVTQQAVMLQGDVAEFLTGGGNPGVPPASKAAIKGLRTVEAGEVQKEESCPVCLDEYGVEMPVKEMPCKHRFHDECIEKWLGMHGSCPVCRFEMPEEKADAVPVEERPAADAVPVEERPAADAVPVEERPAADAAPVEERPAAMEAANSSSVFDHHRAVGLQIAVEENGVTERTYVWGRGWRRFNHSHAVDVENPVEESNVWGLRWRGFSYRRAML